MGGRGGSPLLPSPGASASASARPPPEALTGQADAGLLVRLPRDRSPYFGAVEPPPQLGVVGPSCLAPTRSASTCAQLCEKWRAWVSQTRPGQEGGRETPRKQTRNSYPKKSACSGVDAGGRKRGRRRGRRRRAQTGASCRERTPTPLKAGASPGALADRPGQAHGRAPQSRVGETHWSPHWCPRMRHSAGRVQPDACRLWAASSASQHGERHGPCHSEQRGSRQSSVDAGIRRGLGKK